MKLFDQVTKLSGSAHTGRALKAARVLNLIGTVRGAVTTVLLASSAIGGAVTVNNVRQDIVNDRPVATAAVRAAAARTTPPPTPTPLTPAGLRTDAEKRLQTSLTATAQAAEDLRKVTVLGAAAIDALVLQTRQKLQARYELALSQIDQLLQPVAAASPAGTTPAPSPSLSIVAVNALVQLALGDMNGIVVGATRVATTDAPTALSAHSTIIPTTAPTPLPTVLRTATPTPTPIHTPTPTVKPSPTR